MSQVISRLPTQHLLAESQKLQIDVRNEFKANNKGNKFSDFLVPLLLNIFHTEFWCFHH